MSNNRTEITRAFWVLGDYFSCLGGARRYFNMPESDIPLYIACQLMDKHFPSFEPDDYLVPQFMEAADPILDNVHVHLNKVNAQDDELANLTYEFVCFANSKLKVVDRSYRWERFCDWLSVAYEKNKHDSND